MIMSNFDLKKDFKKTVPKPCTIMERIAGFYDGEALQAPK